MPADAASSATPARNLIVSLTSYPLRIDSVHHALESLLRQTLQPDTLILWLAEEEFPGRENDLPPSLLSLRDKGLSLGWTHNTRSYKKLVPALREYPESCIVTADDDILYPPEWLEILYADYLAQDRTPMVYAHRAHRMAVDDAGNVYAYRFWLHALHNTPGKSFFNFATGGGGILYPPGVLHPDVCDEGLFMKLAPRADDIWFWAMAVLAGTFTRVVENRIAATQATPMSEEAAEDRLWEYNRQGGNDTQLRAVLQHYPDIAVKLLAELKVLRRG